MFDCNYFYFLDLIHRKKDVTDTFYKCLRASAASDVFMQRMPLFHSHACVLCHNNNLPTKSDDLFLINWRGA